MKALVNISLCLLLTVGVGYSQVVNGKNVAQKYGCFACHNIYGPKNAPGFKGISLRAKKSANPEKYIINSIKNGSQGKWPRFRNMVMPSFKNISDEEAKAIAKWILSIPPKRVKNFGK